MLTARPSAVTAVLAASLMLASAIAFGCGGVGMDMGEKFFVYMQEGRLSPSSPDPESLKEGFMLVGETLMKGIKNRQDLREAHKEAVQAAKKELQDSAAGADSHPVAGQAEQAGLSDGDYMLLLRIVQAEAGNCDVIGRILVANVVLNRVLDGGFPNSITEVVYQKSQFSPVSNGSIDTCSISEQTVEAVGRALSGEDHSQGALYFMNREGSNAGNVRWFDGKLTYLFRHGSHEFYR